MHYSSKKPIIVSDLGGVLEDSWTPKKLFFKKHGIQIGETPICRKNLKQMVGDALYKQMRNEIYGENSLLHHDTMDYARQALKELKNKFRIIIFSSRNQKYRELVKVWLKENQLLKYIDEIILMGQNKNISMLSFSTFIKAKFIINDDIENLQPHINAKEPARIHFRSSSNEYNDIDTNIICTHGWHEILHII